MEGGLYVSIPGVTFTFAFFSSSEIVVRLSGSLAKYCLLKVHGPLGSIK